MRTRRDPALNASQSVMVMLTPGLREQARALAVAEGRSVSGLLRGLLLQRLARRQTQRSN